MAYVPNPDDASLPTGPISAQTAAAEFRALKGKVNGLQGLVTGWNPADKYSLVVLTGGNLIVSPDAAVPPALFAGVRGNIGKNSGKWYFEVTSSGNSSWACGVATINASLTVVAGGEIYSWGGFSDTGDIFTGGVDVGNFIGTIGPGATLGIGYDLDTGTLTFITAGGTTTYVSAALVGKAVYPYLSISNLTGAVITNFGATSFIYTVPANHLPLQAAVYTYEENPNLLINSGCLVDQPNAGAVVNPVVSTNYVLDGYMYFGDVAAKFKAGQNLNAITPPDGYTKYIGFEVIAAYVPAAGEAFWLESRVEGFDTIPLMFSKATAAPVTLLMQVRSNVIGTHSGVLTDGSNTRVYPFVFSIPVANTWTSVAIQIPGDVAGTWSALDTGINLKLRICLGADAARRKSATAGWQADAANTVGATGGVDVSTTLAANMYVTGFELRRGLYTTSTPRELVTYNETLRRCLRYYFKTPNAYTPAGYASAGAQPFQYMYAHPEPMRIAPAVSTLIAAPNNCTLSTVFINAYSSVIVLTSVAAGVFSMTYTAGNTFDARL